MAVEDAAERLAGAAEDGDGEIAANGQMAGRHAVEGRVVSVAGILRDVGGAEDAGVDEGLSEDGGGAGHGEARELGEVDARDFVELVGAAVLADAVIEEGSEGSAGELESGIERRLHDDVDGALVRQQEAGFNEEPQMFGSLRERGRIASC